ncbi:MAG: type II toxin-antitoxin system RelE/ParE family toxin [Rhizobium sp.]|nr:type II toxin-antitoxin system RelE/ParE family toxin [Rhizobium sp.]
MTKTALRDLRDHYDFIVSTDPVAAKRLLLDIDRKIQSIAKLGLSGSPRPFIPGLRAYPYKNRCIYFVVSDDLLTVLRVKHGRQNISPDDFPESDL